MNCKRDTCLISSHQSIRCMGMQRLNNAVKMQEWTKRKIRDSCNWKRQPNTLCRFFFIRFSLFRLLFYKFVRRFCVWKICSISISIFFQFRFHQNVIFTARKNKYKNQKKTKEKKKIESIFCIVFWSCCYCCSHRCRQFIRFSFLLVYKLNLSDDKSDRIPYF